jgi:hypothetical protein
VEKTNEKENVKITFHSFKPHVRVNPFFFAARTFLDAIGARIRSSHLTVVWRTPLAIQLITGALILKTGF